jgi:pSer/pThr/pTyr-binding forkhead associated (FHA) protein
LFLQIRDLDQYFEIRPQQIAQEIIVGRSSGNSAMHPDIDLADYQAAEQGVSRLHMALKYEPNDHVIKAYDLGSANNSFINGQKLHPKEQRVLRHGDEVRLAHLVLRVYFRHPGEEVQE